MKKLLSVCFIFVTAIAVNAQGTKVGVVDADMVIQKSKKGKAFFDQYKAFTDSKNKELKGMIDAFQAKQKDIQAKAASLSEDKRREEARNLERMQQNIKRAQEDAERESRQRLNKKLDEFRKELVPLIRQVALERGLNLVLNYGTQSGIVYFDEATNITDDVIRKYDETQ